MRHYARNIGDWVAATAHLTDVEEVVYLRLVDAYYLREQPLPLDLDKVRRMARASSPAARAAVPRILAEFFTQEHDGWHQRRCDAELTSWSMKSKSARSAAQIRHQLKPQKSKEINNPTPADAPADALLPTTHYPITSKSKTNTSNPVAAKPLPDWLPIKDWEDFLTARIAMKARPTPRAREILLDTLAKLVKTGEDPAAILQQSIARGWRGLFPVKGSNTGTSVPSSKANARTEFAGTVFTPFTGDSHGPDQDPDPRDISAEATRVA